MDELVMADGADRRSWDAHWRRLAGDAGRGTLFARLASWVRRRLLAREVERYAERYFPASGVFVEAGCGTGEASSRIPRRGRCLVGLDFSPSVLAATRRNGVYDALVCADVERLPFRDGALAGVWNLGVMEHFPVPHGDRILCELRRALRPGDGTAILFWPPTFGLSRWVLMPIEWLRSRLAGRTVRFFPSEVARLPSRRAGRERAAAAGLVPLAADFGPRDGFNHLVLVARRSEPGGG